LSDHEMLSAPVPEVSSQPTGPVVAAPARVTRMTTGESVQAKLTVGSAADPLELEADRVAAFVMRSIRATSGQDGALSSTSRIQRSTAIPLPGGNRLEDPNGPPPSRIQHGRVDPIRRSVSFVPDRPPPFTKIQRSETGQVGAAGGALDAATEQKIQRARGGGVGLPPKLSATMGQAMGADFGGVRIHTDGRSNQLNERIQAKAFTTGSDVFFRKGEYRPNDSGGQELLAHELTHVVQQGGAGVQRRHAPRVARQRVSRAPVGKVQRLLSREKLERLSPASKNSVNYRTLLEKMSKYEADAAALKVGAGKKSQSKPFFQLSPQLVDIKQLAKKKVKSRPVLGTLIKDVEYEQTAVKKIFHEDLHVYQGKSYLQAITELRLRESEQLYSGLAPELEQALGESDEVSAGPESGEVSETDVDQMSAATPKERLTRMWESFKERVPNLAMFLEGFAGIIVNPLKLTFNLVKAIGKFVWFLGKSTATMLLEPFINFTKLFTEAGRATLFEDTKTLHFERRTGKSGMGWATLEGIGLWLGNIRNWAGWISVVSGLIGIIPGAQPALILSAAAGGINVLAGFAALSVDGVLVSSRALYDWATSAEDTSVRRRLLLRFFGDSMAVATATAANVTTNLVGSGGSIDGAGSEAIKVNDPGAQLDATAGFGKMGDQAAQEGAQAAVLGGGPAGEALKQGVYASTNAVGGEANNAAEMDEKVAALMAKVAAMKKALRPVYDLVVSVGKVFRGIYGGLKWACEKIAQLFGYLKGLIVGAVDAARPVIAGAVSSAVDGIANNVAEYVGMFGEFMDVDFFEAGVWRA
jgi:hypothetical protein